MRTATRRTAVMNQGPSLGVLAKTPTRYASNPIIEHVPATYRAGQVMEATVLPNPSDADQLLLYFCGQLQGGWDGQVARATAAVSDPYTWTITHEDCLVSGAEGQWDDDMIRLDSLLYVDGTYYLYYTGNNYAVGLATSSDGITFTKDAGNPIFTPSGTETVVSQAAVLRDGAVWYMWYSYRDSGEGVLPAIKLATSTDGVTWTKTGIVSWPKGLAGEYDSTYKEFHYAFKRHGLYHLLAECYDGTSWTIGLATCPRAEGVFTKLPQPVFRGSGVDGTYDKLHVATPTVFRVNGAWRLLFCGTDAANYIDGFWDIGIADYEPPFVAALADWWTLAGETCLAAYQALGAATADAALVNLANPGTYDLTAPVAAPAFDPDTGWTFNGTTQYLDTGIVATNAYTLIFRFAYTNAGGSTVSPSGVTDTPTDVRLNIYPKYTDTTSYYRAGGTTDSVAGGYASGVAAVTPAQGYKDGSAHGAALSGAWTGTTTLTMPLGAEKVDASTSCWAGTIVAWALYDGTLDATQIATVAASLAAL